MQLPPTLPDVRSKQRNRFRSRRLGVASAALASTALAESASATVIYDLTTVYAPGDTFQVDGSAGSRIGVVSGMMGDDLFLDSSGMMSTIELSIFNVGGMMGTDYLTLLNPGDTVDGSLTFGTRGFLSDNTVPNPTWLPGTTGYAGFQFDDGTGTTLYGWLQVQFDASGTDFSVLQWAYEDTGAPISAGAISEPGLVLLLALGLAGLATRWKRQRQPLPPDPG